MSPYFHKSSGMRLQPLAGEDGLSILSALGEFVHQERSDPERTEPAVGGIGWETENIGELGSQGMLCYRSRLCKIRLQYVKKRVCGVALVLF